MASAEAVKRTRLPCGPDGGGGRVARGGRVRAARLFRPIGELPRSATQASDGRAWLSCGPPGGRRGWRGSIGAVRHDCSGGALSNGGWRARAPRPGPSHRCGAEPLSICHWSTRLRGPLFRETLETAGRLGSDASTAARSREARRERRRRPGDRCPPEGAKGAAAAPRTRARQHGPVPATVPRSSVWCLNYDINGAGKASKTEEEAPLR